MRFGNDHVHKRAAGQFLVQPRSREIHVARNEITGLDQHPRQDVFGAAPLVRRHNVPVAVILLHRFFEVIEILATRVGFIALHHSPAHCQSLIALVPLSVSKSMYTASERSRNVL